MFTIRIDHANGEQGRDVFACARYKVSYKPTAATLTLVGVEGQEGDETVVLSPADRAFVMNEAGATVDQVSVKVRA